MAFGIKITQKTKPDFSKLEKDFTEAFRASTIEVGEEAKAHFLKGFRLGGYQTDKSSSGWVDRKRDKAFKTGETGQDRALLVKSGDLRQSIRKKTLRRKLRTLISVFSEGVSYADVHNNGFRGVQKVSKHIRLMKTRGGDIKEVDVKSHTRNQNIPQREFIGMSAVLEKKIERIFNNFLKRVKPKYKNK